MAESAYTSFHIGNLSKKLDIETRYGSIDVSNTEPGFEIIRTDVGYCSVKLGFDERASYKLKADTRYCGVSFNENNADITQRVQESNSLYLEAVIGDANTQSEVNIDASYGSVKLY